MALNLPNPTHTYILLEAHNTLFPNVAGLSDVTRTFSGLVISPTRNLKGKPLDKRACGTILICPPSPLTPSLVSS